MEFDLTKTEIEKDLDLVVDNGASIRLKIRRMGLFGSGDRGRGVITGIVRSILRLRLLRRGGGRSGRGG
jgi:hypothetical protein